ncbi:MAG: LacI family DNA-binding transcriptional regulator [Phycisphaerales bacterium]
MPTIREVADKSGVSTATVSRVLAGGPARLRCSPQVVQRVETIAKDLGYRVNYHMRSVRKKRSDAIGYITERHPQTAGNEAGGWYFEQILEGVQAAVQNAGCAVMQVRSNKLEQNDKPALMRGLNFVQERRLDGLVLPGILSSFQGRLDNQTYDDLPVVVVEPVEQTRWCAIRFDELAGIQRIIDHLMQLGHRQLLWLGPAHTWTNRSTIREQLVLRAAFSTGVQGHCCFYEEPISISIEALVQRAEDAMLNYLAGDPPPFTAIVAYNDLTALGVCRALARRGISVPGQVSVTGFDDHCASLCWPPVTTVTHELFEMGRRAGELVLELVNADPAKRAELRQHHETFTPRLVVRESTGPAPA